MNNVTEGDLLTELAAQIETDYRELLPGDVTVSMLMRSTGKKRNYVERFLQDRVAAGKLIVVSAIDPATGRRVNAYRKPDNKKPA